MKNQFQLREEYAKYGIDFSYNERSRKIFLKIQGAPLFAKGTAEANQLTGWYNPPGGIRDVQDVAALSQRAKDLYRERYAGNPEMLQYVDAVEGMPHKVSFILDDELLPMDDCQTVNGYVWAVDSLVDRLPPPHDDLENVNFYADLHVATGEVKLTSTYDTPVEDGELHKTFDVPLSQEEKAELTATMEKYCQQLHGKSCLAFMNEARAEDGLPALVARKPALRERVQKANNRVPSEDITQERPKGPHGR